MKQAYRLSNIFGLDANNAQHSIAVLDAINGIDDVEAFIDYCRDHKEGIEYVSKTEKLDILANKYKKLQESSKLPTDTAIGFSKQIARKISEARTVIKNSMEEGVDRPISRLSVDGEKFFSDKEIKALSEIGSVNYIISLSETGDLEEKLIELFVSKFRSKTKYESLTNGQKKINGLLGSIKKA